MDDISNLDPNQIKQMISLLQKMLPQDNADEQKEEQDENMSFSNSKIKTSNRRPKPSGINKFDTMMEAKMHKEDVEIDKKLNVYGPTPRTRKYTPISVRCRVCGKSEQVNPNLVQDSVDRYKCNACSRGAG